MHDDNQINFLLVYTCQNKDYMIFTNNQVIP